ncbi:MAG: MinD/ParA family protein, partial [Nanoarchaeota archaeon]
MGITLGLVSIKGGVGKTTIAASLATDLANNYNKKVLLIDANYSAPNLGLHMDIVEPKKTIHEVLEKKCRLESAIHHKFGVDVVPGDYNSSKLINYFKLKSKIESLKEKYDFIILDSSPSYNEEILSTILASDSLFIVTTPDYPTLSCSLKTAKLAKTRGKPVSGVIINKIRDPLYEITIREIEKFADIPVIAKIPDEKKATRSIFT